MRAKNREPDSSVSASALSRGSYFLANRTNGTRLAMRPTTWIGLLFVNKARGFALIGVFLGEIVWPSRMISAALLNHGHGSFSNTGVNSPNEAAVLSRSKHLAPGGLLCQELLVESRVYLVGSISHVPVENHH